MATIEPWMLTASEASARIRQGALSPVELVESCLRRIDALEPKLKAWVTLDRDGARREAGRLERECRDGRLRGPLHGLPVAVKDIFYTAGIKTTAGFPLLADFVPDYDAAAVTRLKQAGAIILGKATTAQFAVLDPAETTNPWNVEHTPGGSSSGSGAAVAARMCPLAIGSQTGGSTIRPAGYCGVVGFKPSYGLISCHGMIPLAESMDCVGIFGRSVDDAAMMLQVLAGYDSNDPNSVQEPLPDFQAAVREPSKPPRIALIGGAFLEAATAEVREHVLAVGDRFAKAGAQVEKLNPPEMFARVGEAFMDVLRAEGAAYHRDTFEKHPDQYGPKLRGLLEQGRALPVVRYIQARQVQRQFRQEMAKPLSRVDAVIAASAPAPAPKGLSSTGDYTFNAPWTFAGFPVIGLPSGLSGSGLPLAIQLVGAMFSEERLLATARWCESVLGFDRMPSLGAL